MDGSQPDGAMTETLPIFLAGDDEASARLREFAFGALVANPEPVDVARLATLSGLDRSIVGAALLRLAAAGRIDRDDTGRVLGAAGLTIADAPHGLELGGHAYRTWCAFDAIGIPAALGADARIETTCPVCDRQISIALAVGRPPASGDAPTLGEASNPVDPNAHGDAPTPGDRAAPGGVRLWLSDGGADMRADFCTPTVLLCSREHALEWADRQGGHGRVLDLAEATIEGAQSWRSAADVAISMAKAQSA